MRYGWLLLLSALAAAVPALAQQKTGPGISGDESLTWHGITLYGVIDVGVQYDTHSAPFTPYRPAASGNIVRQNSSHSVTYRTIRPIPRNVRNRLKRRHRLKDGTRETVACRRETKVSRSGKRRTSPILGAARRSARLPHGRLSRHHASIVTIDAAAKRAPITGRSRNIPYSRSSCSSPSRTMTDSAFSLRRLMLRMPGIGTM